jgi:signal transduction histidine kinase
MDRPLEPGLLRIFRYFTGIAMIYFALVMVYAMLVAGQGLVLQAQSSVNFATNLALFGYLSWPWLARRLRRWYLPVGLVAATIIPVASNLLYLAAPEESLYVVIARSWLVLPILVVPLVITAWQYRFRNVVGFIIFTTGVELLALIPEVEVIDTDTLLLLGVPAVRAFAFGTVGHIVSRLTATQREQREALMTANVQLAQHAQTLAQLAASRERNRLARELHDTLAHTLSGLAVNLEALKTVMPPGADEANHMLDDSLAITRTGLGETRRALRALRAQPLEDLGLSLALRHQALSITTRANLALDLELTPDIEGLSPEAEQNLYRIVQEGLENIARHADARRVALRLVRAESGLVLTLEDDGRGFEPADSPAELSYGLRGMRERAEEIGARLTVESRPGAGTVVTVTLQEVGR